MSNTGYPVNRRQFLETGAKLSVGASALGALSGVPAAQAAPEPTRPGKTPAFIIDAHIHCGGTEAWVQDMVRTYRPRHARWPAS